MPNDDMQDDFAAAIEQLNTTTERDTNVVDVEAREVPESEFESSADRAQRARDDSGRFAPKTAAKEPVKLEVVPPEKEEGAPTPTDAPKPPTAQQQSSQAPVSWKPEERAAWAAVPPQAQAAILRRDREVDAALRTSSEARQLQNEFQRVLTPYLPMLQAEQTTPLRAVESLLQTAAQLRTAAPGQKASLVADLIMQFSIDPEMLGEVLVSKASGKQPAANPMDQMFQQFEQRLKPVFSMAERIQQMEQRSQQQMEQSAEQAWQEFVSNPEHPHADELREDIANLLGAYAQMQQPLSLQDAYKLATMRHPTISAEVQRRQLEGSVAQQTNAARRAREAAVSLPSQGGAPSQEDDEQTDGSLRSDLASSIRKLSGARR